MWSHRWLRPLLGKVSACFKDRKIFDWKSLSWNLERELNSAVAWRCWLCHTRQRCLCWIISDSAILWISTAESFLIWRWTLRQNWQSIKWVLVLDLTLTLTSALVIRSSPVCAGGFVRVIVVSLCQVHSALCAVFRHALVSKDCTQKEVKNGLKSCYVSAYSLLLMCD